jgi:hypothetical protein
MKNLSIKQIKSEFATIKDLDDNLPEIQKEFGHVAHLLNCKIKDIGVANEGLLGELSLRYDGAYNEILEEVLMEDSTKFYSKPKVTVDGVIGDSLMLRLPKPAFKDELPPIVQSDGDAMSLFINLKQLPMLVNKLNSLIS